MLFSFTDQFSALAAGGSPRESGAPLNLAFLKYHFVVDRNDLGLV
jgi:hypothetical protein